MKQAEPTSGDLPGNTGGVSVELAEPLLVVSVPDVHVAVTPSRGEGVILTVGGKNFFF